MSLLKPRKFKLHFNRIAMQSGDKNVWSIRLSDRCLHAEHIVVDVPLKTVFKPKARQPRAFFVGEGRGYWITDTQGDFLLITNQTMFTVGDKIVSTIDRKDSFR